MRGKAKIKEVREKKADKSKCRIIALEFQNEFLSAKEITPSTSLLACCPDLICLMDAVTGVPIYNEDMRFPLLPFPLFYNFFIFIFFRYGQRVTCFTLPASQTTTSPLGLKVVSPRCFGVDVSYTPPNPPEWDSFCPSFE